MTLRYLASFVARAKFLNAKFALKCCEHGPHVLASDMKMFEFEYVWLFFSCFLWQMQAFQDTPSD